MKAVGAIEEALVPNYLNYMWYRLQPTIINLSFKNKIQNYIKINKKIFNVK